MIFSMGNRYACASDPGQPPSPYDLTKSRLPFFCSKLSEWDNLPAGTLKTANYGRCVDEFFALRGRMWSVGYEHLRQKSR